MNLKKIVIADDHEIVRGALRHLIEENKALSVVAETGNACEVLDLCRQHQPNLLILDISLNGRDGLELLKNLKSELPQIRILMFSMHDEMKYGVRSLQKGAWGYVGKQQTSSEVQVAINCVLSGRRYVSSDLAQALANRLDVDVETSLFSKLSDRELQILRMIVSGLGVSEIARELNLSVKTISMYRTRTLKKLMVKNTAELIRYALENRL